VDYCDFGRRVRKHRLLKGWTQEMLAEQISVSTSFVGHIERGSRKPSLETVVAIANTLEVSLDYLLAGSINNTVIGPVPAHLNEMQVMLFKEIAAVIIDCLNGATTINTSNQG